MEIQLYNVMNRKKEVLKPITKGEVGIYSCGPTVYWHQHIGNLRTYIFADILRRIIEYNELKVKHIINITDVGHLTNDSDDGDDKMELAAKKEGKKAQDIAKQYFEAFHKDLQALNLKEPTRWTKATKHIKEQIEMIQKLEKKGHTYKTSDGIYFDTTTFKDYGKLSRKKIEDLQGGKRIQLREKKNKTDFALWKFSKEKEKRQQEWNSPWGKGFPGWHIECSAMATKYLGEQFDIHTGGEDHLHIHHENEIAQSECALNTHPWVKIWMHGAFLNIPQGKMSKSKGTIETLTQLNDRGINPMMFKYFTYTAHYRKPLTWSKDAIRSATQSYNRLKEICSQITNDEKKANKEYIKKFHKKINNDLDIPGAIAILWKLVRDKEAKGKKATIKEMEKVLALNLLQKENITIPKEIQELAKKRLLARKNNDWKTSDELRELINKEGWNIKDEQKGYTLEKM